MTQHKNTNKQSSEFSVLSKKLQSPASWKPCKELHFAGKILQVLPGNEMNYSCLTTVQGLGQVSSRHVGEGNKIFPVKSVEEEPSQ